MLVRYVFKPSENYFEHFMIDLQNIITGSVSSPSDLLYANTTASKVYGSYPTGLYNLEYKTPYVHNQFTYALTISKLNNADRSEPKSYIRFEYIGNAPVQPGIQSITLSNYYNSANDYGGSSFTGVMGDWGIKVNYTPYYIGLNSQVNPESIPIDIIVNKDMFGISQPLNQNGDLTVINDLGHTALTKLYTDSMISGIVYCSRSIPNPVVYVPKTYKFSNNSNVYCDYGAVMNGGLTYITPIKTFYTPNSAIATIENPVSWYSTDTSYMISSVYGWNKIPESMYGHGAIYKDSNDNYRYVVDLLNQSQAYSINIT